MNIASIDIGTNTVLLLIIEVNSNKKSFNVITNRYEMPRLGRGLIPGSPIPKDNIERFLKVINGYSEIIKKYDCKHVFLNATNAMRIASNAKEIIDIVKYKYGYNINVIPGETEAYLSFLGASSTLPAVERRTVIDIGGGSTEIILGTDNELEFRKSFLIGAVSLTEECTKNDPPTADEIISMREKTRQVFASLDFDIFKDAPVIAVAGTPTTLTCIRQELKFYDELLVEGSLLNEYDLANLINMLSSHNAAWLQDTFGKIVEGREDVLLAGTIILEELMKMMKQNQLNVSGRGLRYGAVIDFINTGLS